MENGFTRLRVTIDHAMVLGNKGLCQSQSQPRAPFSARDQWVKNTFFNVGGNARAIVYDFQMNTDPVTFSRQRDLALGTGTECDAGIFDSALLPIESTLFK